MFYYRGIFIGRDNPLEPVGQQLHISYKQSLVMRQEWGYFRQGRHLWAKTLKASSDGPGKRLEICLTVRSKTDFMSFFALYAFHTQNRFIY